MGERVNGVLYLDRIPGKTFSKQLVLDVAEWNFSTHVYCGLPHDVNYPPPKGGGLVTDP